MRYHLKPQHLVAEAVIRHIILWLSPSRTSAGPCAVPPLARVVPFTRHVRDPVMVHFPPAEVADERWRPHGVPFAEGSSAACACLLSTQSRPSRCRVLLAGWGDMTHSATTPSAERSKSREPTNSRRATAWETEVWGTDTCHGCVVVYMSRQTLDKPAD
jgi:hypothetical protein